MLSLKLKSIGSRLVKWSDRTATVLLASVTLWRTPRDVCGTWVCLATEKQTHGLISVEYGSRIRKITLMNANNRIWNPVGLSICKILEAEQQKAWDSCKRGPFLNSPLFIWGVDKFSVIFNFLRRVPFSRLKKWPRGNVKTLYRRQKFIHIFLFHRYAFATHSFCGTTNLHPMTV